MKHFVVTFENRHWPMTYKTTMAADAYDCIVNLLQERIATNLELSSAKAKFIKAIGRLMDGEINSFDFRSIDIQIRDGEV